VRDDPLATPNGRLDAAAAMALDHRCVAEEVMLTFAPINTIICASEGPIE
jgi:hypothetical protein